jgi:hypothetical protein
VVAANAVRDAPAPDERTKSKFPHLYRNQEGSAPNVRQNFENWETPGGRDGNPQHREYPIVQGAQGFNYNQKTTPPNYNGPRVPNDPGPFRAVTTQDQNHIVGAIYHPVGNPRGFERAQLQQLDQQGRELVRRAQLQRAQSYQ